MTLKSMNVKKEVWEKLTIIKAKKNFESLNDVIEYLLERAGERMN